MGNCWHEHPENPEKKVFGEFLRIGATLKLGDKVAHNLTKGWEDIPYGLIGKKIETAGVLFVRPPEEDYSI